MTGQRMGGYLLHEAIATGGFADTYFATDARGHPVVFRILRKCHLLHFRTRRRFECGVQLLRRLEHPNIIRVLDVGTIWFSPFVVLEFIDGWNLNRWLNQRGADWLAYRLPVARGVALALEYLHERGLLHLDVKAENVLLGRKGEVRLIDFDLACKEKEAESWRKFPAGTRSWLAPELIAGHAPSKAADLYSYGLFLRELFPEKTGTELDEFARDCLSTQPLHRPNGFSRLLRALVELEKRQVR